MRTLLLMGVVLVFARAVPAAEPAERWLTGAALVRQLAQPIDDVDWSARPLREVVNLVCYAQNVAVLIDRRVDPDQPVSLKLSAAALEKVLREIARKQGIGVCFFGPLVYYGPVRAAAELRTVAAVCREEIRSLPPLAAQRLLAQRPLRWKNLATPRELLLEVAAEGRVSLSGLGQVPHDLWAAADLPPLALVDRLTLLAGQFGLTLEIASDGEHVTLVPLPEKIRLVRSYPGGRDPQQWATRWRRLLPEAEFKVVAEKVWVRGLLEDHEQIAGATQPHVMPLAHPKGESPQSDQGLTGIIRKAHPASHPAAETPSRDELDKIRVTGLVKGQLDRLLKDLAAKYQVELDIDQEALDHTGISLRRQVSVSVKDATLEKLFNAILQPAGCSARRDGKVFHVGPRE